MATSQRQEAKKESVAEAPRRFLQHRTALKANAALQVAWTVTDSVEDREATTMVQLRLEVVSAGTATLLRGEEVAVLELVNLTRLPTTAAAPQLTPYRAEGGGVGEENKAGIVADEERKRSSEVATCQPRLKAAAEEAMVPLGRRKSLAALPS